MVAHYLLDKGPGSNPGEGTRLYFWCRFILSEYFVNDKFIQPWKMATPHLVFLRVAFDWVWSSSWFISFSVLVLKRPVAVVVGGRDTGRPRGVSGGGRSLIADCFRIASMYFCSKLETCSKSIVLSARSTSSSLSRKSRSKGNCIELFIILKSAIVTATEYQKCLWHLPGSCRRFCRLFIDKLIKTKAWLVYHYIY